MSVPVFHLAMLAEMVWAGFGSLRLGLGMGGRGSGWGSGVWLLGAVAIQVVAGVLALRRRG